MYKREFRKPRSGEIEAFMSNYADQIKKRENELRLRPSPCCGHNKSHNMSCQINTASGLWRCFHCSKTGNWFTFTKACGRPIPISDRYVSLEPYTIDRSILKMFKTQNRRPVSGGHYPKLLDYCLSIRGIEPATLDAFRVTSKGENCLRWPIYTWDNDHWAVANMRVRRCLGDANSARDWFDIKGGPTGLMIGNHLLDPNHPDKRAIIFEGQWDVMTAYQLGIRNVFSLPNGANNIHVHQMLQYIPDDWEIWLAMDHDAAGDQAIEKWFAQLGSEKVARLILPYKDLNDWHMAKPDLTKEEVLATARGFTASLSKGKQNDYMEISLDDAADDEVDIIVQTPWLTLTDALGGGWRSGETTGILAPSGKGKTTLVNQCAVWAAKCNVQAGIISLEGNRTQLNKKLRHTILAASHTDDRMATIKNLKVSKLEGKRTSVADVLQETERLLKDGCKLVVIDNLDFITQSNDEKMRTYGIVVDLAKDFNAHIIVVWQPNKIDKDSIINSGNQKGYSQALQDSSNYLSLNAFGTDRRLELEKCREFGEKVGSMVWLTFDVEKRVLIPTDKKPEIKNDNFMDL